MIQPKKDTKLCLRVEKWSRSVLFGVFRLKNYDFKPKNHIFSNFREGVRVPGAPPWFRPCQNMIQPKKDTKLCLRVEKWSRSV
jgi:hypothetical protein